MIFKAHNYRLYPNKKQKNQVNQTFGCTRFVFNHVLSSLIEHKNEKEAYFSKSIGIKTLPVLKKKHEWLKKVDSISLQATVEYLFEGLEKYKKQPKKEFRKKVIKRQEETGYVPTFKDHKGHPIFKSKRNLVKSYTTKMVNGNIDIEGNRIKLPKLGWVRFAKSREIEGRILRATVRQNASGKYFVSIVCELPVKKEEEIKTPINHSIGMDMGLKEFAILSNGDVISNPKFYRKHEPRLHFLQRKLSRQQIGSHRWLRTKRKIANIHEKIQNKRHDFLHKWSTTLVNENQVIGIEDLKVKNMMKNHKLAKSIGDVSWSMFLTMLKYKAEWNKRDLIKVSSKFPSSQLCHVCEYKNAGTKDLSVRTWTCPSCETTHDRDENASKNIEKEALRLLDESLVLA